MHRWTVAALAVCAAVVSAQGLPPTQDPKTETKHLTVTTSASPDPVVARKPVTLAVDVVPKPKMHVYSPGQEGYIAITLTLDANPAVTAAKAKYPAGEKLHMPALNETQLVYSKPFRITQAVSLRPDARIGDALTIKGTLRYQACDDRICYLPTTIPLEWTVRGK